MGNEKIELSEKLSWVYLNKVLLELPEEKRVKSIETLATNPDPEFPFAVLVHISDVPEELKRKAIRTIFSNNRWPSCGLTEFLSQVLDYSRNLSDSLKEEVYAGMLSLPDCQYYSFSEFVFFAFEERSVPDYWKREMLKKVFNLDKYDFIRFIRHRLEKFPTDLRIKALEMALEFSTPDFLAVKEHYFNSGDIPDDLKRKAIKRLAIEDPSHLARVFKNIAPDIKKQALEINHQGPLWRESQEIFQTIGSVLPVWLASYSGDLIFDRINGIPVFRSYGWMVIDQAKEDGKSEMILLGNGDTNVLLIRDVSHQNIGYAIRVPPNSKNAKEAHAYICRQDPAVFDGFEREV